MTERYLVVGLAKTGTTVISKTIQNSRDLPNYYLEPKRISFFDSFADTQDSGVVKIIFDHWNDRRRLLNAIIHNDLRTNFAANIFITRDPRAQLISRINYVAFPYFHEKKRSKREADAWIGLFRRKETDPGYTLRDLANDLSSRFNVVFTGRRPGVVSMQYANYLGNLGPELKSVVRYEDFIASKLDDHPLKHLFAGSRDVGEGLHRTRRSGEIDDWTAFVTPSDLQWINETFAESIDKLGYSREVEVGGLPDPENCSLYVARIIEEANQMHKGAK